MKKILLLLILVFCASMTFAQDVKMIQRRAAQKVGQMNQYIASMASKQYDYSTRQYYRTKALNLFIGRGDNYTLGGVTSYAKMQVSSLNGGTKPPISVKQYFTNLINLKYTDVKIQSTNIIDMQVSTLREIDDDTYVCTVYYEQVFLGFGPDGTPRYGDRTRKSVQVYIFAEQTEDGTEYTVLLGDTKVISTERL